MSTVHVLALEQLKFLDKSYQQPETSLNLSIKKEKYQFQFESVRDRDDWVNSLCFVSSELWTQKASSTHIRDSKNSEPSEDMMKDNFLYDSCGTVQQFKVSVCPTKASAANKLQGYYILNPTVDFLRLAEIGTLKGIHEWPYKQIRKYGNTRLVFKMEVGRNCSTGEGEFEFFTPECATLVNYITLYTSQAQAAGRSKQGEEKLPAPSPTGRDVNSPPSPAQEIQGAGSKSDAAWPAPRSRMNVPPTAAEACDPEYSDVDVGQFGTDMHNQPVDRKMSERERKCQEQAAAKLLKQEKAALEKAAKLEQKEKEKKQKDTKEKGRPMERSGSAPAKPRDNIYDEPGDIVPTPQGSNPPAREAASESLIYSTPNKPHKDGWKTHARSEDFQVHTEDYCNIKAACQAPSKPGTPITQNTTPHFIAETDDDTYNRLGDFSRQRAGPENIYGTASAKDTLDTPSPRPPPVSAFAGGNEYEDADDVAANSSRKTGARAVKNEYEDTAEPFVGKH
ncbi:hypothetical protein ACOMHN_006219 [Nucella lapillus]